MSNQTNNPLDEEQLEETAKAAEAEEASEAAEETAEETTETPDLQKQFDELNDRYMRMAAEYDNFRKRVARERDAIRAESVGKTLTAMLPVFDSLERALAQDTEDTEYKKGVEMTARQFTSALESINVEIIAAEPNTEFDPTVHNAVMHIEDETFGENCVAECFQKGFKIGDKVIRTAMVKVAN
ncbi:MAG: nucleotide exchange factor GrpE [Eubacteriales bacterium]|nr:nucleotide exchange factor GrpE [Eubacteriales bacterium]